MVSYKNTLAIEEMKEIEKEIDSIEHVSSGEIVPVIAKKSSAYRTIYLMNSFVLSYIFMLVLCYVYGYIDMIGILLCTVLGVLTIYILSLFDLFKRILIPRILMSKKVNSAAMMSFYKNGVYRTESKTGILIYISLFERMVVVVGDEGIHSKVENGAWDEVVKTIIHGIRTNRVKQGIVNGIESSRELLQKYFPASKENKNELSNKVIYE